MRNPNSGQQPVLVEDRGPIRILTLNRPDKLNAIDMSLRIMLFEELDNAMQNPSIRVVILTGAEGAFSSGGDISTMENQEHTKNLERAEAAQRIVRCIWQGSKPVIAAVEGPAFGAGVSLAAACDRMVVAEDARFGTAFMGVGLAGDLGIYSSLPARVGQSKARQLMLLPQRLNGRDAGDIGLADAVVPSGDALSVAVIDAEKIAQLPPLAVEAMKSMMSKWPRSPYEVLDDELQRQVHLFGTNDFQEGVEAFKEKRTPRFMGQ